MSRARVASEIRVIPLVIDGEIKEGDSLSEKIVAAVRSAGLRMRAGDLVVVKHKVVSKAEGGFVDLEKIPTSRTSRAWAKRYGVDARVTELALREAKRVIRRKRRRVDHGNAAWVHLRQQRRGCFQRRRRKTCACCFPRTQTARRRNCIAT